MSMVDLGHPPDVEPGLDSLSRRTAHLLRRFSASEDGRQGRVRAAGSVGSIRILVRPR